MPSSHENEQDFRILRALPEIERQLAGSHQRVYRFGEIQKLLDLNRTYWHLERYVTARDLLKILGSRGMRKIVLFGGSAFESVRYLWGDASPYALALSIRPGSYLSHAAAAYLHGLLEEHPTIHVNKEQSPKTRAASVLTQEAVDRAFSSRQRQSKLSLRYGEYDILLLNGKNTGQSDVETMTGITGELLELTNLERTLIELVVRPVYAGGLDCVYRAFRAARARVSTDRILATLRRLDYVYPYHQAIGFLMERAQYPLAEVDRFSKIPKVLKFYLSHGISPSELAYDSTWQIYYPTSLSSLIA